MSAIVGLVGAGTAAAAPVTLSAAGGTASVPQVAVAGDGTATVVWLHNDRVQAVRIDATGTADTVADISTAGETASGPQVAVGVDGIATIVWTGAPTGSESRVQAVRFGPSGVVGWVKTLSEPAGSQPQVAVSADGTATVAWTQYVPIPNTELSQSVVQATRLTADGTMGSVSTLTSTAEASLNHDVAVDSDGVVTIVWFASSQIKARRFDASGEIGSEVVLSSGFDAGAPQVAAGSDGAATVTWATTASKIKAVRWEKLGSVSAVFDLSDPARTASSPRVAASGTVATIVYYQSDGTNDRMQLVRLGSGGATGAVANLSAAGQNVRNPQVAAGPDGAATVVWRRSDGTTNRVQAVRVAADSSVGSVLDLSDAGQGADVPQVGIGAQGPAMATWTRSDGTTNRVQAAPVVAACDPNCTWASTSGNWSAASNWSGSNGPAAGSNKSLVFPALSTCPCTSTNDLTGVSVDGMTIDTKSSYTIGGNGITLGADGLKTTSAGSKTGSALTMPLTLAAPQTWSINSASLTLRAPVSGSAADPLTVNLTANLQVRDDVEVGPFTASGSGAVLMANGASAVPKLNATNGQPVSISNGATFFAQDSGTIGPLTVGSASVSAGLSSTPVLTVNGTATFSASSTLKLLIRPLSAPPVAGTNYGQLNAAGNISLGGSSLAVDTTSFACGTALPVGNVYTLAQTTGGSLSGKFSNAGEGAVVSAGCSGTASRFRIHYTSTAVTATVVATPTLSTTATSGTLGDTISDTASVTGGQSPTGTVTFKAYSNSTCTTAAFTSSPAALSGGTAGASFTPATAGSYYWVATYSGDSSNEPVTSACHLDPNETSTVTAMLTISPSTLPGGTAGQPYSQSLSASGGTAPYSFTIAAGALPAGLTLSSGGTLSGTPTAGGNFTVTVKATDSAGTTGTKAYGFSVSAPTITVSPTSLPHATVGHGYSQSLNASAGTPPYSFSVSAGALPPGLTFNADGTFSGTPTASGSFNFIVSATDSSTGDGPYSGSRNYTLVVDANGAPVVSGGGTLEYTENAAASAVSGTLSVADPEGDALKGASVAIGSGYADGEDRLSWADNDSTDSIELAPGASDQSLSLTGSGSAAQYQAALRAVKYRNSSEKPSTTDRTVTFSATDSLDATGSGEATIDVTGVNDAPSAAADSYSTGEDTELHVSAPGLLANDDDVDSTTLTAVVLSDVSHGTLNVSPDGSFSYLPASNFNGDDGFTYKVNDGSADSNVVFVALTVDPANDAPVVTPSSGSTAYTEGGSAAVVDSGITVSDSDDANIASARMSITTVVQAGDQLLFTDQAGIQGLYADGVLTLSGSSSKANYETALRSVTFATSHDDPALSKTVEIIANDGSAASVAQTKQIAVTRANDAPTVTTTSASLSYSENAAASEIDSMLTVRDPDSAQLSGATVKVTAGYHAGQDVLAFTDQHGITGLVNGATLTLSGSASVGDYLTALRSVTYRNSSDDPSGQTRTVSFQVTDSGSVASNVATRDITVAPVNDRPVVSTSGGSTAYSEGAAVTVDPYLTVSDADNANLTSATVTVTNFEAGDLLVLTPPVQNGITGVYHPDTGVLNLTGSSSKTNYEAALRAVQYDSPSVNPSGSKTVEFTVNDGSVDSATASKSLNLSGVNDAPTVTTTGSNVMYSEDSGAQTIDPGVTLTDPEGDQVLGAIVKISGNYASGEDVLAFTDGNGITGSVTGDTLTLSGTASAAGYQAALRSVTYRNSSQDPATAARTVLFGATDAGSPSATSDAATRDITVTAADDAPVAVDDAETLAQDAGAATIDVLGNDTDVDGGPKAVASKSNASHGAVTSTGSAVTYKPDAGYCNTVQGDPKDTFTYALNGGSTATVTITVTCVDTDADGNPDRLDADDDNDGVSDGADVFPLDKSESIDTDGDRSGDNADTDDDGDGVADKDDAFPNDRRETVDADRDGVGDNADPDHGRPDGQPEPPAVQTRLALSHRRIPRLGAYIRLTLRCRGAAGSRCAGVITLDPTTGTRRLKAAAARGRYGRRKFDVAAGKDRTVDVRATRKLLADLRRRHRVIVLATAVFTGQDATAKLTIERKLTVVEPRARRPLATP